MVSVDSLASWGSMRRVPEDGLICEDSLICSSGNVCSIECGWRRRALLKDSVRMCESNFACEFIGQLGPFCLPIETLPEALSVIHLTLWHCVKLTLFVCRRTVACPMCSASPACPEDWQTFHWTNSYVHSSSQYRR